MSEPPPPLEPAVSGQNQIANGFARLVYEAVDGLRTDVREDLTQMRNEQAAVEGRLAGKLDDLFSDHGRLHEVEEQERQLAHGKFYEFIRQAELSQARRDGVLGVVRFVVELFARNAGRLGYLAGAVALLVGFLTGALHVQIGQ